MCNSILTNQQFACINIENHIFNSNTHIRKCILMCFSKYIDIHIMTSDI